MPPANILVDGLVQSCSNITMAFGLVLVFSILGILSWTHGQYYMLGAYVVYYAMTAAGIPFPVSILIAGVLIAGLGIAVKKFIIDRMANFLYVGVATLSLIFVFEGAAAFVFGIQNKGLANVLSGVANFGSFSVSYQRIAVIVFTFVIMAVMYLVLNYTRIGLAIRAASQEPASASLYGVDVSWLSLAVMGIGCALAAMAGGIMAPISPVNPYNGRIPLNMSLLAIVIGGTGSLTGAIVGGVILGIINSIVAYYVGYFSEVILFVLVIIVLLVRPQGLLGAAQK